METIPSAGGKRSRLEHAIDYVRSLEGGLADGQIDRVYSVETDITSNTVDVIGTLLSQLSNLATSFIEVTGIVIEHRGASGNVIVGNDTAALDLFTAKTHSLPIRPGGLFVWYAPTGLAPVATTGDVLKVAASAGTIPVTIVVIGRSA